MAEFGGTSRFEVVRRLGAGGMGVVYEAIDRAAGARVALKTLRNFDARAVYRLKTEFRALQDIEHPNLVSLGELVESEGRWFFTMELVPGEDFLSYARPGSGGGAAAHAETAAAGSGDDDEPILVGENTGVLDEVRLRDALAQLCTGIAALHGAGKVHRDIKPSNIRVTDSGRVVVLDFGLITDARESNDSSEAHVVGTAAYMAPEQAASKAVGPAADWYSVGAMLYEALTGRLPFTGAPLEIFMDKQRHEPPPPRAHAPGVPADLDALCAELLRFDPSARPRERDILKRVAADIPLPTRTITTGPHSYGMPFLGRESEIEVLDRALERTHAGEAATVFVRGQSGVGKSALIRHFADRIAIEQTGVVQLAGRCYERESVPYKAFDGVVDALSRYLARQPDASVAAIVPRQASLLPRVFPVLGAVEAIAKSERPRVEVTDPLQLRARVFGALRRMLRSLAEQHPLLLLIDDLQWADTDSALLLEELMREPGAPPLLLLISSRTDVAATAPREPQISGHVDHISLEPLGPRVARRLATILLDRAQLTGEVDADQLAAEADGHPLYIAELVRHAAMEGDQRAHLRLDDAIWWRAEQLSAPVRGVLEIVALADAPLPTDVVRRASKVEPAEFAKYVSLLRVANLVKTGRDRGRDTIEPYHDRVRESVFEHLDDATRERLHVRIGTALEAAGAATERPELLVRHLEGAGETARAADYAREAARRAADAFAFDRAALLYDTALRLGEYSPEAARQLRVGQADALANAGSGAEAAAGYLEVAKSADPHERLECQRKAAECLLKTGHIERGMGVLSDVLGEVGAKFPRTPQAAMRSLAWNRVRITFSRYRWKERHPSQIAPRDLTRVDVYRSAARGLTLVDSVRGADFQLRALRLALKVGERRRVVEALLYEAGFVASPGGRAVVTGRKLWERVQSDVRGLDDPLINAVSVAIDGILIFDNGQFQEAGLLFQRALAMFGEQTSGTMWEINAVRAFEVFVHKYLGEVAALYDCYQKYAREARQRGDRFLATTIERTSSLALLLCDGPDVARAALENPWSGDEGRFDLQQYYDLNGRCELALYERDAAERLVELRRGFVDLRRSLLPRFIGTIRIDSAEMLARLALAVGDTREATHQTRKLERERADNVEGSSLLLRAAIEKQASGDTPRMLDLLHRSIRALDRARIQLVAAAARCRLGECLGGDEGAGYIAEATEWMAAEGIYDPSAVVRLMAPGFDPV